MYGLRADRVYQQAVIRSVPFWLLSPVLIVIGGALDGDARVALWVVAIVLDIGGSVIAGRQAYRVSAAHFAERYQLFVIIALGESIVAIGVGIESLERDLTYGLAAAVAFAGAALLWWAYFDFAGIGGERALRRAPEPIRGRLARDLYNASQRDRGRAAFLAATPADEWLAAPF